MQVHTCYRPYTIPPAPVIPPARPATTGWECPVCHAVMAWFVASCINCKGTVVTGVEE